MPDPTLHDVVLLSGARTAIGTFGGSLAGVHEADLGGRVAREAASRAGLEPDDRCEVVVGCVGQVAESGFLGRMVGLKAGFPEATTAVAVNRQCGSGLESLRYAALQLRAGEIDTAVAVGTENMSALPYYLRKARTGYRFGNGELEDGLLTILTWPGAGESGGPFHNGMTAENLADRFGISREEQDAWALRSQEKAAASIERGDQRASMVGVEVKQKRETRTFDTDEHPRGGLTLEKLGQLRPAFRPEGGTVTAANASGINDGAAAVVATTRAQAEKLGVAPRVRVLGTTVAGCSASTMGYGPVPATRKLLDRLGLGVADFDRFEINEAFASQTIACVRELGLTGELEDRVNPDGGAIAFGHPVGASGTILTVRLMDAMQKHGLRRGLITMCIGGGQGIATAFELEA